MTRILVLVQSYDREPWAIMERTQRETWAKLPLSMPDIEVAYYYGVPAGIVHYGGRLLAHLLDGLKLGGLSRSLVHREGRPAE
jgi:hypothetical protein